MPFGVPCPHTIFFGILHIFCCNNSNVDLGNCSKRIFYFNETVLRRISLIMGKFEIKKTVDLD